MSVHLPTTGDATAFFRRYGAAFDRGDWPVFVSMYHEPCLSVRADASVRYLQTRDEARRFFEGVSTAWRREEYERFETSDLEVVSIGQRCLLVTLDWHMLRGDGSLIRRWRQSYQLIMVAHDWQVLTSTFHAT